MLQRLLRTVKSYLGVLRPLNTQLESEKEADQELQRLKDAPLPVAIPPPGPEKPAPPAEKTLL